ncbi:TRAP transporter large permease, partial [Chloroflexota bacterium]
LMGYLASIGGLGTQSFDAIDKWLVRVPAGAGIATIFASAAFGATTGASIATVMGLGPIVIPRMRELGYDDRVSISAVTSGGLLAIMIPPSIPLVVYGSIANVSIPKLLLAAYIPGVITTILFAATVMYLSTRVWKGSVDTSTKFSLGKALSSTKSSIGVIIAILVVFGGLYSGIMTATEIGALGVLTITSVSAPKIWKNRRQVPKALRDTVTTSCMVFILLIAAELLSKFITLSGVTFIIDEWLRNSSVSPVVIIIIMLLVYVPLGMFLNSMSMFLVTLPLFIPIVRTLGFDPVWFGILAVVLAEVGMLTPPLGITVYAMNALLPDVPLTKIFRAVSPFLIAELVVLLILIIFPQVTLWLPNMVYGN